MVSKVLHVPFRLLSIVAMFALTVLLLPAVQAHAEQKSTNTNVVVVEEMKCSTVAHTVSLSTALSKHQPYLQLPVGQSLSTATSQSLHQVRAFMLKESMTSGKQLAIHPQTYTCNKYVCDGYAWSSYCASNESRWYYSKVYSVVQPSKVLFVTSAYYSNNCNSVWSALFNNTSGVTLGGVYVGVIRLSDYQEAYNNPGSLRVNGVVSSAQLVASSTNGYEVDICAYDYGNADYRCDESTF